MSHQITIESPKSRNAYNTITHPSMQKGGNPRTNAVDQNSITLTKTNLLKTPLSGSTTSNHPNNQLTCNLSSWNVRGCATATKRLAIDCVLEQHKIEIACIQETKTRASKITSDNYE
jgi:hypothetical protein